MNKVNIVHEYPIDLLYTKFKDHRRLKVFANKGTKCVACGREGTRLIKHRIGSYEEHVDLYTSDLVLMTVDHIRPKCEEGGEELNNKQTMCTYCNSKKGSKYIPVIGNFPVYYRLKYFIDNFFKNVYLAYCIIKEFIGIFTDIPANYKRCMRKREKNRIKKLKIRGNNGSLS